MKTSQGTMQQQFIEVPRDHRMRNNNELYKGGFGQYGSRHKFKFLKSINVSYWLNKIQANTQLSSLSGQCPSVSEKSCNHSCNLCSQYETRLKHLCLCVHRFVLLRLELEQQR